MSSAINRVFTVFLAALIFWGIMGQPGLAQEEKAENAKAAEDAKGPKKEEAGEKEEFTNSGLISISNKSELSKDRQHISFNIINNAGRSIANLFGWVYKYEEDEAGRKINFVLANYPHKGGVYTSGGFHKPGGKGKWRFILKEAVPNEQTLKFLLLVNMNSIFFAKVETLEPAITPPAEDGGGKGKEGEKKKEVEKKEEEKKTPEKNGEKP
ncbi:MAG: hypothetical protein HZA01_01210 [Nitrospinae bacterium]|nr:hypothetical protein [Nitrospinota bacterium]